MRCEIQEGGSGTAHQPRCDDCTDIASIASRENGSVLGRFHHCCIVYSRGTYACSKGGVSLIIGNAEMPGCNDA